MGQAASTQSAAGAQKNKRALPRPATEAEAGGVRKRIKLASASVDPAMPRTPPEPFPVWSPKGPSFASVARSSGRPALGEGGYGSVEVGTVPSAAADAPPRRVAIKLVSSQTPAGNETTPEKLKGALSDAARELRFLQDNRSKFLMSAIGGGGLLLDEGAEAAGDDENTAGRVAVAILMDEMTGGDLESRISNHGSLPQSHCKFYAASVVLGLENLHSRRILHRDIKAENVLIGADGYVKICDFGFSKQCRDSVDQLGFHGVLGTLHYYAPEIAAVPDAEGWVGTQYSKALDLWCVGVLVYYCMKGRLPFTTTLPACHDREEAEVCNAILAYCRQEEAVAEAEASAAMATEPAAGAARGAYFNNALGWTRSERRDAATSPAAAGRDFVEKLLRPEPSDRLGMAGQGGYDALRKHVWFEGFDWVGAFLKSKSAASLLLPVSNLSCLMRL